eukprot:TRINITY_DN184_c3_g1_i1.p1 TRINITY_DN184_c3_g1~~TRINITY_DN184_c3_g1_i1.p1  ORF type:complete len:286 (+),score=111.79 TRINITY_DN184_c3_g1_i1:81-938(+)
MSSNNNNEKENVTVLGKRTADEAELPQNENDKKKPRITGTKEKPIRVYCDGIFDLFHFGHARALKQAKFLFEHTYLLVGVCDDKLTHSLKGKTVLNDYERYEAVSHCKWVDEVIPAAPWVVTREFLDKHKIDFVAHGEDPVLDENGNDLYEFVKNAGQFQVIQRTRGISTTDLILRIVKDYDSYVMRNLQRGKTREDMNIGYFKEKQIEIGDKMKKWGDKIKEKYSVDIQKWKSVRDLLVGDFVELFNSNPTQIAANKQLEYEQNENNNSDSDNEDNEEEGEGDC